MSCIYLPLARGSVRLSPGPFTTAGEVDESVEGLPWLARHTEAAAWQPS